MIFITGLPFPAVDSCLTAPPLILGGASGGEAAINNTFTDTCFENCYKELEHMGIPGSWSAISMLMSSMAPSKSIVTTELLLASLPETFSLNLGG